MVMRMSRRTALSLAVLLLLGAFVLLARWQQSTLEEPGSIGEGSVSVAVTSGTDRGPGSLREALFLVAGAHGDAKISIRVPQINIETALPPLVSAHSLSISAEKPGAIIDAHRLDGGPVFDVAGANTSLTGITVRNCADTAILLRAPRFKLESTIIESCDVGVDVAENARNLLLERNRFSNNRIGVRFAASNANTVLEHNEFAGNSDAGVWAVRGAPDHPDAGAISMRSNRFDGNRAGIVAGNVTLLVEDNDVTRAREVAIHLIGAGATVRGNRVREGGAMGIAVENARDALVEKNELDHLETYAIMVRGSANVMVRVNRIHNCGYGIAFVLGEAGHPSSAVENTLLALKYHGIDVIGDSPILRRNRVEAQAIALHTQDLEQPGKQKIIANPFLDNNTLTVSPVTAVGRMERSDAGVASR
jgi:parallel beta-helix repeat protein